MQGLTMAIMGKEVVTCSTMVSTIASLDPIHEESFRPFALDVFQPMLLSIVHGGGKVSADLAYRQGRWLPRAPLLRRALINI